jgi:hypothetical protein
LKANKLLFTPIGGSIDLAPPIFTWEIKWDKRQYE